MPDQFGYRRIGDQVPMDTDWDNKAKTRQFQEGQIDPLDAVAQNDVDNLRIKDKHYGSSWMRRGGVGAFMMLARKWDRIEQIVSQAQDKVGIGHAGKYDIFEQCEFNYGNVLDDVRDLRRYLLLVESELFRRGKVKLDLPPPE